MMTSPRSSKDLLILMRSLDSNSIEEEESLSCKIEIIMRLVIPPLKSMKPDKDLHLEIAENTLLLQSVELLEPQWPLVELTNQEMVLH